MGAGSRPDAGPDSGGTRKLNTASLRRFQELSLPSRLLAASALGFAAVFTLSLAYGKPGLGLGQLFYVPVVLAALATGPLVGGLAGVTAIVLYETALLVNGTAPWESLEAANTPIRLVSYILAGATVGYFATQGRRMLAESLHVLEDLLVMSRRDLVTASLSSEGLENAINKRLASGEPFALLVGETTGRTADDELRLTARLLRMQISPDDELARIGPTRFAILSGIEAPGRVRAEGERLERALAAERRQITFGWASSPAEGKEAFELFGAAIDRLQARRLVRGEWEPTAASAELVDELPVARYATE